MSKYLVEDLYGFRVPIWAISKELLRIAVEWGYLKKVVNPWFTGVKKKRGAKR